MQTKMSTAELAEFLPETGQGYLTRLQLEQSDAADAPLVRVEGLVTKSQVALTMSRDLMESGLYSIRPQGIE